MILAWLFNHCLNCPATLRHLSRLSLLALLVVATSCALSSKLLEPLDNPVENNNSDDGAQAESHRSTASDPKEPAIFVETLTVTEPEGAVMPRSYTGVVKATRTSELGFKRTGRVEQLMVTHGDVVRKGDVLAMLDTASLTANLAVITAQRAASDARLRELVAGPRKQTLDAARAQVAELEANREQLRITYERNKRLMGTEVISQQNYDDARLQFAAIEKKLSAQKHVLDELEEGTRAEQIEAQRAEIAQFDASLKTLQVEIEESKLLAPFDAIISRRLVDEGTIVAPGLPLFRVVERTAPEAWVGVPPEVALHMSAEKEYPLSIGTHTYPGRLKCILPELDNSTRTQTAVLSLPDLNLGGTLPESFAFGQIVQLKLSQEVTQAGYWIPLKALTRGVRGLWSAFVVEEVAGTTGDPEWVVNRSDVEIVQIDSDRVLVRGTLHAGDRIVTSGVQKLTSGQRVRIQEMPSAQLQISDTNGTR